MCECINNLKDKIKNEIPSLSKEHKELVIEKVICESETLAFGDKKCYQALLIPFKAFHQTYKRKKSTIIPFKATYCPFCGEKYIKEE